jgi:stress-induced morphogen
MALQIINAGPDPEQIVSRIREAILAALPGAQAEVRCASPGHFEIQVTSEAFAGKSVVQQHQLVYGAITELMSGDAAPVHAVDRLECRLP